MQGLKVQKYEALSQKLCNCASQATYWHGDGLR
jgi:hypothetical protein